MTADLPDRVFDYPDPVPVDLAGRWTAARPDRLVLIDLVLLWSTAGAAVAAVFSVAGLFLGGSGPAVALLVMAVAIGLAALLVRRALTRRRVLLPARDIDLVVTHRREVSLADSGDQESLLARRGFACAAAIKGTSAWRRGEAGGDRLLLDPDEEARQIYVACAEQQRLRSLLPELDQSPESLALRDSGQDNLAALTRHVEEFERFHQHVAGLSAALDKQTRVTQVRRLTDRHLPLLAMSAVNQELAADRLRQLAADVEVAARSVPGP